MKKLTAMITFLSLSTVLNANPADPTQGYCQTVDPSVCGWGGGRQQSAPYSYYRGLAYSSKTGKLAYSDWYGQPRYTGGEAVTKKECKKANNGSRCDQFFSYHHPHVTPYLYVVMGENPHKGVGKRGRFQAFEIGGDRRSDNDSLKVLNGLVAQCQNADMINCQPVLW